MKNKLNYLFILLAAAFVLAAGCKKEEATDAMPDKPSTNAPAAPEK